MWNEKKLRMEREMRERELELEREMQDLQLKQERELLDRQLQAEREFIRKRDVIRQEAQSSKEKVQCWLNERKQPKQPTEDIRGAYPKGSTMKCQAPRSSFYEEEYSNGDRSGGSGSEEDEDAVIESMQNLSINTNRNVLGMRTVRVTKEQLAARQAVSKHLPTFKGEPEIWPLFISSFEYTTQACGFSNIDNLKRLQDSLQGVALEAVRSRLVLPDSVPDVIRDLRNLFGKPEKLLKTLMVKVRSASAPRIDRLESFIHFGITVKQLCDHLEAAQLKDHLNNPMLVQELVEKLPPSYKLEWVRFKRGKAATPLRLFTDYITEIVSDVSEVTEFAVSSRNEFVRTAREKSRKREFVHHHEHETKKAGTLPLASVGKLCGICRRADHKVRFCDQFKQMNLEERLRAVDKLKLCQLCLNSHGNSRCTFKIRCTVKDCGGNHHYLLHRREESVQLMEVGCNAHKNLSRGIIFRMVPVTLSFGNSSLKTLAFLDEGSSSTLVDDMVAKHLKLRGEHEPLTVTWTGGIKRHENRSQKVKLLLSTDDCDEQFVLQGVRTVSELMLPKQSMRFSDISARYPHLANLPVVDRSSEDARILLGLDNLHLFAPLESCIGKPGEPIAVRSTLGWTVYGPETQQSRTETFINLHSVAPVSNQEIYDMMRAQFVMDEVGVTSFGVPESAEDQRARELLQKTTVRVEERFQTGLLWREDVRQFPDSYPMAIRRLKALEKKLDRNAALKEKVVKQIADYQTKGYAHQATIKELTETAASSVWYLPLNVALNPRKPDKVRLVWDAAATVDGVSLNSTLMKGPDMLVSLPEVINHFREKPIAFGGDIAEMYHQIRVKPEDRSAQRFLFREHQNQPPQTYVMDVLTFGATCSPCSAQFVKNLNARRFINELPEAVNAIIYRHYVDDYYDSVDTIEEAITRTKEVKYIHEEGGFCIRNWVSNSRTVLEALGEKEASMTVRLNLDKDNEYERVLGIVWEPLHDVFTFSFNAELNQEEQATKCTTKRMVLSSVMALFDPLGLLSPVTIRGRMLVQDLWRTGCEWDESIDSVSFQKWQRWTELLQNIETLKIPRSYFGSARTCEIEDLQLHVFTDASETAYGCVAYFRAAIRGEIQCALVMSRSKVAPLKLLSIPRLELQAALLGSRLARTVRENHSYIITRQFLWTDSQTVLSWIRSDQRRYKQFVGFRIGEILSLTKVTEWNWVPTKLNVADKLTKWGGDLEVLTDNSWIRGPMFLYQDEEYWPKRNLPQVNTTEELRVHLLLHNISVPSVLIDVSRFSKWMVLVRTVATLYRFISNLKKKIKRLPIETLRATNTQARLSMKTSAQSVQIPLLQAELLRAEQYLLKVAQMECYIDELKVLTRNRELPVSQWLSIEKSSPLYKLTPLVDDDGLIRMEGRSERADFLPFDLRFPIILPADHSITKLIVHSYHERFGHVYRETVKNELKQRFHVLKINAVIRELRKTVIRELRKTVSGARFDVIGPKFLGWLLCQCSG
ncbi:uncharacterized protein LOC134222310 [Armigeres subalbatus]|uniref:uncharacterized protein LOC134222310 n=1 Tax=Armigeres subalbatus TaxID=124917 RepID=UPI002ED61CF4